MSRSHPSLESLLLELIAAQNRIEARLTQLERTCALRATDGTPPHEDDPLYDEARRCVVEWQKAATSYLQRKLGIGYGRASRLIDLLEERGVIGPNTGATPRAVLVEKS